MLEFFRKYQRSFMTFIAVVIVVSFSFFGTYSAIGPSTEKKDFTVGHAVDGSDLRYSEIRQLSSLLGMQGKDGVFQQLLLKTGAAESLFNAYYEALKVDWQGRVAKARGLRFYKHPAMPVLDARSVWAQLVPGLIDEVGKLQKMEEVSPEFFAHWARVYSLQEAVPPELVQRVLLYQQSQAGLPQDPRLMNSDFALFGCRSLEDWFGRTFLDLASQFVLNGSALAAQQKMVVSQAEARADYLKNFGARERELQGLGISRSEGIRLWKKALGFIRWCEEIGEAALIDPLPLERVAHFTRQKAVLDVYRLPLELRFSKADDLIAFETYARIACAKPSDPLSLPESLLPVEEIAKRAPELTASVYRVRSAKLDPASIGCSLSLREVWDWQVDEEHWSLLQKQFGWLQSADTADGRFALLEKLDPASRKALDAATRIQMVFEHPEWIESGFASLKAEEKEILVSQDWVDGIEVQSVRPFADLLSRAHTKDPEALEALRLFRDGGVLFRIEDVEQIEAIKVLSFAEAKAKGRIPVEKFLEREYRRIRGNAPSLFKSESGEWKPLQDVRETAVRMIFSDLFRYMDKTSKTGGEQNLDVYARLRFQELMQRVLSSLQAGEPLPVWGLWNLETVERIIERNSSEEWMNQQPFILQAGQWSPVHVPASGEVVFFFLKEHKVSNEPVLDQIQFAKETLSSEAKRRFADRLLEIAVQKQALVCPIRIEGES